MKARDVAWVGLGALTALVLLAVGAGTVLRLSPYVAAVLIIGLAVAPFLISFERRRPTARDVVLMAVLVALAVASRAVFAFVPHFKPMAAVVMIAGIALGARSGFWWGRSRPWPRASFSARGLGPPSKCSPSGLPAARPGS